MTTAKVFAYLCKNHIINTDAGLFKHSLSSWGAHGKLSKAEKPPKGGFFVYSRSSHDMRSTPVVVSVTPGNADIRK